MNAKIGLVAVTALIASAVISSVVTANIVPRGQGARESETNVQDAPAMEAALKEAAEARAKAVHWETEAGRLAKQLANTSKQTDASTVETAAMQVVGEIGEVTDRTSATMDAAMRVELEEYRARDRERQQREREREERNAERREEWAERQVEMLNQRTDMFTELIERTDDPAEKQRWADIEHQMTASRDLMRQMREAETDEERAVARDAMRQSFETTQSLYKQQQDAVLQRALKAEGISDASQVSQIQRAVESSLSDEAFRFSDGGRGFGGPPRSGRGPGGGFPGGFGRGR